MRIPSGKTDQAIFFVAVDSVDYKTRETGLSSFTVVRSRNSAAPATYTSPTVTEIDDTDMPGVYALLIDEDTTIASGSDSEEYCVHITHAGMAPVTRTVELYRRAVTSGQTIDTASGGVEVGTFQSGAITSAAFAANSLTASALAGDAVTEIQSGLATASALSSLAGAVPTANANADALLDRANAIEVGLTPRQAMRLSAAADGGKLSGAATSTNTIRNAVADTKDRIVALVDADGNRTAITYDLT